MGLLGKFLTRMDITPSGRMDTRHSLTANKLKSSVDDIKN